MELIGLAAQRFLEILQGALDPFQGAQMGVGMHRLGLGRRAEQLGNLRIAFGLGLLGNGEILAVGPAKASFRFFSVLLMSFLLFVMS